MATSSLEATKQPAWLGRALIYALIYAVVGVVFATLAGRAGYGGARFWRLAAWLVSAIAFGTHLQFERVTAGRSVVSSAWHAAFAAALGAFLLAISAVIHRHVAGLPRSGLLGAAVVVWPALTAVAAFLVGAAAAFMMRPHREPL